MFNELPWSMKYLWSKILMWSKNETILILISSKRYFGILKSNTYFKSSLTLRRHCNFWPCSIVLWLYVAFNCFSHDATFRSRLIHLCYIFSLMRKQTNSPWSDCSEEQSDLGLFWLYMLFKSWELVSFSQIINDVFLDTATVLLWMNLH